MLRICYHIQIKELVPFVFSAISCIGVLGKDRFHIKKQVDLSSRTAVSLFNALEVHQRWYLVQI